SRFLTAASTRTVKVVEDMRPTSFVIECIHYSTTSPKRNQVPRVLRRFTPTVIVRNWTIQ
ncbi:MAG: hypothetical protein ACREB8_12975, partial [Pseudolabrys sp.]